ncbi:MAG: glycosyltransferase family 9 protein [Candidatus Latescibacterota bacterium]
MNDRKIEKAIEALSSGGRILLSRLQYLGDVVLTLPVAAALKERFPTCDIDYLVKRPGAELLEGEPGISAIHRIPDPGEGTGATLQLIDRLRRRRFDVAIDFLSNPRSALLLVMSGAPVRIGGTRRIRRHLYTHTVHVPADVRSAISHHLHSLTLLDIDAASRRPALTISQAERGDAARLLDQFGVRERTLTIGIHPGGKWQVKRWPVESFAALAERLNQKLGACVVVFTGPGEEAYSEQLQSRLGGSAVRLPVLPVRRLAAVMSLLDAAVYGDGGAMHVSVAVGTPTVGIFGSSEPDVWFPYEEFGSYCPAFIPLECRPCHVHACDHLTCLNELSVTSVEEAVAGLLDRRTSASASKLSWAADG